MCTINYITASNDVDECQADRAPVCQANADCQNTVGASICVCRGGFLPDNGDCVGMCHGLRDCSYGEAFPWTIISNMKLAFFTHTLCVD